MALSEHESLGRWLGMLYRRRDCYYDRELQAYGIGPGQYRLLRVLYHKMRRDGKTHLNQQAIGKEIGLDKSAVARSVKKLEAQGFIRRERSSDDGRVYRISLTDKAHELEAELWAIRRKWTRILGRGFTQEEQRLATELMRRMAENADAFLCGKGRTGSGRAKARSSRRERVQ